MIQTKYIVPAAIASVVLISGIVVMTTGEEQKVSQSKPAKKPQVVKKEIPTSLPDIQITNVRTGPPSKRSFNQIIVTEKGFIPATEFRKWDQSQWAEKVTTLRDNGKYKLANQYLKTYDAIHPDKKLVLE